MSLALPNRRFRARSRRSSGDARGRSPKFGRLPGAQTPTVRHDAVSVGGEKHVCNSVHICGASVGEMWDDCGDAKWPTNSCRVRSSKSISDTKYGIRLVPDPKI